jgi:hypothetical protein
MQWTRNHLSFANVISVIALFVALGGASYAAVSLPKNSVKAKQIAKNAVGTSELKKRAVRGADINNNAVSASKIQANAISGSKVLDGSLGSSDVLDNNLTADDLADSSVGSGEVTDGSLTASDLQAGLLDLDVSVQFAQAAAPLANGAETSVDVHCLPGQTAIGGGTRGDLTNSELTKVTASRPITSTGNSGAPGDNGTFTGWRGTFVNENNGADIRPEVWVICVG